MWDIPTLEKEVVTLGTAVIAGVILEIPDKAGIVVTVPGVVTTEASPLIGGGMDIEEVETVGNGTGPVVTVGGVLKAGDTPTAIPGCDTGSRAPAVASLAFSCSISVSLSAHSLSHRDKRSQCSCHILRNLSCSALRSAFNPLTSNDNEVTSASKPADLSLSLPRVSRTDLSSAWQTSSLLATEPLLASSWLECSSWLE